jgi:hypothetical protein
VAVRESNLIMILDTRVASAAPSVLVSVAVRKCLPHRDKFVCSEFEFARFPVAENPVSQDLAKQPLARNLAAIGERGENALN